MTPHFACLKIRRYCRLIFRTVLRSVICFLSKFSASVVFVNQLKPIVWKVMLTADLKIGSALMLTQHALQGQSILTTSHTPHQYPPHTPQQYSKEANTEKINNQEESKFGKLDVTLSEESQESLNKWTNHDNMQDNFCELDDIESPEAVYYDLVLNPERFTGYTGPSAVNVWRLIYDQNCFKHPGCYGGSDANDDTELSFFYFGIVFFANRPEKVGYGQYLANDGHVPGEENIPQIDIWLPYEHQPKNAFAKPTWGPNLEEFIKR
ncbi:hypothetical protein HELRODRAFT_174070 [Helobdella robusta]|uniref:Uncharacterized protein n=1 Tax=Helobdella robusta TaxID=6412 RepID=T1F7J9_HELRO|nr:hypothetical protein HELRODRAFT_174070 [Helobdella robusta]ESO03170.1 hypothetical protein HELRODRAFT_174070 [Helobdella robusta]